MISDPFSCSEISPDSEGSDPILSCTRWNNVEKHGIENVGFLDLSEILEIIDPIRVHGPAHGPVSGISIDTRKPMGEDYVFWAIRGEHFNGNDFVEDAIASGARAAVVSRDDCFNRELPADSTLILVPDTLNALQDLAAAYRRRFTYPVVGITGSNGKTLVKEMLASILCLERKTYRSPLSYNTQVGASLGLLGMRPEHQVAVIEAGISLPGEMDRLERMIRPDHGILTVISKAHIGGLGTIENTLQQKQRLFKNLRSGSFLLLNADDPLSLNVSRSSEANVVTFGLSEAADVRADDVVSMPERGHQFRMRLFDRDLEINLPVAGRFNILNALAAAAGATLLGASPQAIQQGLREFRPSPMRLEIHTTVTGVTLINDTYNSDPASMKGALDVLAKVGSGRRKIAILSEMLDLGLHSREEHLAVGKEVVRSGADHLITVGENAALIGHAAALEGMNSKRIIDTRSYKEAAAELEKIMNRWDVVLFKGSRWFRLERIAKELVGSIGPTRLVVNLDAIAANIKKIRGIVGEDVAIMPVVKSFGYGNDSIRTSRMALENGANYLAVAFPDEGAALRENRIDAPILAFNVLPEEVDKVVKHSLSCEVASLELANALHRAAAGHRKIPVHLKIDTGMGRSGVWVDDAIPFVETVSCLRNLEVEGIMTHFSSADDPGSDDYTLQQIAAFEALLVELKRRGYGFRYVHAGNTAAVVRFPQTHYNMVRPGLAIYGMYPSEAVRSLIHLEQVISFTTKISQIKEHPPGRCISYNRRFVTAGNCRIATIHVGYNDGYPRFQSNIGQVLVRGRKAPVVGTVCMDATMIDVTDIPDAKVGDEVVLIGRQGDQEILADDIAANGGTINYEIACKISPRVTRIFVQS
ncbi:MAG: alanine racemase [Desulfomonile tiedjei]|uniref:Multifunctional fusion protein n=1 Tax=Desulfomonile tiedjei TaxID=2358 RepID=A0A9D6V8W2_9BACT|nr:alanine racemase [Desulfomonile tiedjei]